MKRFSTRKNLLSINVGFLWSGALLLLFVMPGCTTMTYRAPSMLDLTGRWELIVEASSPAPDVDAIWDTERQAAVEGRRSDPTASAIFIEQDFPVVKSSFVEIVQDDDFIGLQYQDTPFIDLKWGEQVRDGWRVEVGWMGQSLIISKKRGSIQGAEKITLSDSGERLDIRVVVSANRERISLRRVFSKQLAIDQHTENNAGTETN